MIVREIKDKPEAVLANFDYLRDWADTRAWLEGQGLHDLVARLDAGHTAWLRKRNANVAPTFDQRLVTLGNWCLARANSGRDPLTTRAMLRRKVDELLSRPINAARVDAPDRQPQ